MSDAIFFHPYPCYSKPWRKRRCSSAVQRPVFSPCAPCPLACAEAAVAIVTVTWFFFFLDFDVALVVAEETGATGVGVEATCGGETAGAGLGTSIWGIATAGGGGAVLMVAWVIEVAPGFASGTGATTGGDAAVATDGVDIVEKGEGVLKLRESRINLATKPLTCIKKGTAKQIRKALLVTV